MSNATQRSRDIRQQPRPGDVVRVRRFVGEEWSKPLVVQSVEPEGVRWRREGQGEVLTPWNLWHGQSRFGSPPIQLLLVREGA